MGTYEQKSGNDYDIASLLIGILRDRGIPAKYVRGEIEISAAQAMAWTGAKNARTAAKVIAALGIPATSVMGSEDVASVRMEHIWVLAYVPYTDYRGTGNNAGKSMWIPLDASFKKVEFVKDVDLVSVKDYIQNDENLLDKNAELNGVNIGDLSQHVSGSNSTFTRYMLENGYGEDTFKEAFGGVQIIAEDDGYLPLSTPYNVNEIKDTFDDIPDNLTQSITIGVKVNSKLLEAFGQEPEFSKKFLAPDIYGKRIVISYDPATEEDKNIIEKYNGIFNAPAYLLKLKPVLYVDGEAVAEGNAVAAGTIQKYSLKIDDLTKEEKPSEDTNIITAGGMYLVALDYGIIATDELQNIKDNVDALKDIANSHNLYTEAVMGEVLNSVAKSYFEHLDLYNQFIAGQKEVIATRGLSAGIVGFGVNSTYTFLRPTELNEGGIFLDICHDVHSVVSLNNTEEDEKAFMLQAGIYGSTMEHGILEQFTGIESVSTMKALQYATENGIKLHTITADNYETEIKELSVEGSVVSDIKKSVTEGKTVIIPEKTLTINQWKGSGYMVLDTDTYACGYMISGGLNGGSMTWQQMLEEYLVTVAEGAIGIIVWEVLTTAILAMTPCGWVFLVKIIFEVIQVVMLIQGIMSMVELFRLYEETGDATYLQKLTIQLAAIATLSLATKLFGDKIAKMKEKVAEEIDKAGLTGKCFVAGTLIFTVTGMTHIEEIKAGDYVQSFNPGTMEVSEKRVEETFVRQTKDIIKVYTGNEIITTTQGHPFYVMDRGFMKSQNLRAGDKLCTVNGDYVVVEKIQHEILENPINVYNFRVADNHTYYVGKNKVGVHNSNCSGENFGNKENPKPSEEKKFTDVPFDENGNLKPNSKYKTGEFDYNYETDANGRIDKFQTDDLRLTERDTRLKHDPNTPGKLEGDHAGHIAGDRFGGSPEIDNLVSQSKNVNLSKYRKIENQWAKSIKKGKKVTVEINIEYEGSSTRPSKFDVKYTIDGQGYKESIMNE